MVHWSMKLRVQLRAFCSRRGSLKLFFYEFSANQGKVTNKLRTSSSCVKRVVYFGKLVDTRERKNFRKNNPLLEHYFSLWEIPIYYCVHKQVRKQDTIMNIHLKYNKKEKRKIIFTFETADTLYPAWKLLNYKFYIIRKIVFW